MALPELHDLIDTFSLSYHLENTPFGVILWDGNMKVVYCSKRAAAMLGCAPDELLQKPINLYQFVHEEDAAGVAALVAEITSGRTNHNESLNRNLTKDGKVIYCQWYNSAQKDNGGKVINILSLIHDVTSQVETQLALKKSQHQLSLAFNSAIDPMWLIRVEGHNIFRFETINLAFTKVTGWTPEQVEGQPIEKIMPEASHDLVREKYNEAIESGKIIDYIEEALHPAGIKYGEIRVIPIHGESGEPVRILGIANDITEKVYLQKKLDAEREIKSRQITSAAIRGQESERSKVSRELHDNVNQVLTTIKLYIELCIDQKIDTASILPKCVAFLNDTINEIRSLSKQLSAPSLGSINFKESLTELFESLRSSMQIDVHIEFGALPFLEMESELHLTLYRVAQEQVTNIIKHAKADRVNVSLTEERSLLRFTISDNGVGFDLTQKTHGIGITNMQSRVEILNGHFQIKSSPGAGTCLEVEIPVIIEDNICYAEQAILNPAFS
ncbi:PAS domain S-box protein [Chitinophagaceae bacterium LB-8]|uniref:Oxygen sensor histidine kinase NreB n=1 Tax=Paraflavisolibacter caeni TaxID=2982496 RepID=A0A9X2XP04_9BACT|nr:PAS domain S-box protein [Paraflavisolibacter caeni]MCU7550108.1 PAS domain S-box protein [Paraflavisolibacter caeni]